MKPGPVCRRRRRILLSLHISYSYTGQAITNSLTMICFVFFFFRRPGVSNTPGGKPAGFTQELLVSLFLFLIVLVKLQNQYSILEKLTSPRVLESVATWFGNFQSLFDTVRFFGCFSQFKSEANLVMFFQKFVWIILWRFTFLSWIHLIHLNFLHNLFFDETFCFL